MSSQESVEGVEREKRRVSEKLARFPESARDDFWLFKNQGDAGAIHRLTLAILVEYSPKRGQQTVDWVDSSRLIEDIGFDSLAIAETVFFFEELFEISISNEEILRVRTLGELRDFVREKASSVKV